MPPTSDAGAPASLLARLAVHQDYVWFAALLGWSLALVVWWWHPHRRTAWAWLPWSALTGGLAAVVQFIIFSPPFEFFHDRLIPGTLFRYSTALVTVDLFGDLLLGFLLAIGVAGWWLPASRPVRLAAWFVLLIAASLFPLHPASGSALMFLTGLAAVPVRWRAPEHSPLTRATLLLAALLPFASTVGPLAGQIGWLQRDGPPTPMGLVSAGAQTLVAFLALGALLRGTLLRMGVGDLRSLLRQAWPLLLVAGLWLVAGLAFAHRTGEDNRRELLQNRLRLTAVRAMQFDGSGLDQLARNHFGLAAAGSLEGRPLHSPLLAGPLGQNLSLQMIRERNAAIYVDVARLLVIHEGSLLAVATSHPTHPPGHVEFIRRASLQDLADWEARRNLIVSSPVTEIGQPYSTLAALTSEDGRMLGWLEFRREEFFQSLARKWRTGPLLITALGLVLSAQWHLQRRADREREAALRAAAIAAETDRLKTAFLAKVSHELRTPIQSLLGYGELLRARVGDDAQARAWLGALQQHGEIMTRLIDDLLDLSAAGSGAFRLAPSVVSPGDIVQRIVDGLRPRADAKGLRLTCTVAPAVPAWVEADGGRLAQITLNLTGNALKFTDQGKVAVTLDAAQETDGRVRLRLAVRDTGPGIPTDQQARLFVPFSRLDSTAAKEGTGLGLALSEALCRAMDGSLLVESDGVNGSCFVAECRVPLSDAPVPLAAPLANGTAAGSPPTVLIVEDNTLLRELFTTFLRECGCACTAVASGTEALARAREAAPDMILLDLSLPDADGIALAPDLRALAPTARIVGASARAGESDRARALAAGMDFFLAKPIPLATLASLVCAGTGAPVSAAYPVIPGLFAAFLRELAGLQTELADAVAAGDLPRVRRRVHYLRNSALAVQADELFDAATHVEDAAARGDADATTEAWPACAAVIARELATSPCP